MKVDPELGEIIHCGLVVAKKETPFGRDFDENIRKGMFQKEAIASNFKQILVLLGLDTEDASLRETPRRVAKMFVDEVFYGLDYSNFPACTVFPNEMQYDEMLVQRNITIRSFCEHHFMPIEGIAHIGYIPSKSVIGLSKLNRIADFFARRPQVQERLVEQIFFALSHILETENVAVMIDAKHHCICGRGINDALPMTTTTKLGGVFKDKPNVRQEFLSYIK